MLEGEGDKKKKVYPRLPDMLGKKDTPYYIYVLYDASLEETYAALRLKRLCIIFSYKDLLHHFLSIPDDDTMVAGVNLLTIYIESLGRTILG